MTSIPDEIMEQARALNMKLHSATELGQRTEWLASALLAAEKRGKDEAAKMADQRKAESMKQFQKTADSSYWAGSYASAEAIAAAIRSGS